MNYLEKDRCNRRIEAALRGKLWRCMACGEFLAPGELIKDNQTMAHSGRRGTVCGPVTREIGQFKVIQSAGIPILGQTGKSGVEGRCGPLVMFGPGNIINASDGDVTFHSPDLQDAVTLARFDSEEEAVALLRRLAERLGAIHVSEL